MVLQYDRCAGEFVSIHQNLHYVLARLGPDVLVVAFPPLRQSVDPDLKRSPEDAYFFVRFTEMIGAIVLVEIFFLGLGSFERAIPLHLFFFGARDPLG